ncbi:MAG: hypothetical protein JXQ83_14430, partial [Candidatus Glassbacteria bacterium]|nr:hypothetical protein [Candidatus Glassbacteria bacterium]
MKYPYIALSVAALAAGLYACVFLTGHTLTPGLHPALFAAQQEPAGRDSAESAWTIGIYTGPSPFQLSAPAEVSNPVLTAGDVSDLEVNIVAHPFMVVEDSLYYMFFTAKNDRTGQGGIGLAVSRSGMDWEYRRIVLDEPYDLSYPYVFKWQDDYFMIPEAHTETSLRLYRATDFPDKWTYDTDLLTGDYFISASVVRYNGMWWMFVARLGNETLRLFHAPELRGPWTEHPRSPVVEKNLDTARPGGRLLVV